MTIAWSIDVIGLDLITYNFYAFYPVLLEFRMKEMPHQFEFSSPVFCGEGSSVSSLNLRINQVFVMASRILTT